MRVLPLCPRAWLAAALFCGLLTAAPHSGCGQNTTANEGGDLAFGGPGTEPGKFEVLEDLTFDAKGTLYVLDGIKLDPTTRKVVGNLRVQKFDRTGKLLGAIDLKTAPGVAWSEKHPPQRIAATSGGEVFVTVPTLGKVLEWDHAGAFVRAIELPFAMGITVAGKGAHERIAVVPSRHELGLVKGLAAEGGGEITLLNLKGAPEGSVHLPQSYDDVQDLTADAAGNFYLKAAPNAIYKISPEGKLLRTYGGNATTRNGDGSEVLHTVGVDSQGNVYTFTWGNPSLLTRFDAEGKMVTQREGQFKWGDPWGAHSEYTPLAVDPDDRIWIGATALYDPSYPNIKMQRAVPAIVRTRPDFFATSGAIRQSPLRRLGFRADVKCLLPQNLAEPGRPVPMSFIVAPANRMLNAVSVHWRVFDALKEEVASGNFDTPLKNGFPETSNFKWTPPRYGDYLVQLTMSGGGGELGALGEFVGVAPHYPGMPERPAETFATGGWADAQRQIWTGLPNMRIHAGLSADDPPDSRSKKLEAIGTQLAAAEKAGITCLVQFVDSQKNFRVADVKAVMERYKGKIKYVEVCNEPNFSGSVDDYFKIHQAAWEAAKAIDPNVKVMGPGTVNIDLGWLRRLYELGFAKVTDIISIHDYEGHESIDPVHWRWKYGEARKIMAANGDATKPIWQTERAIAGVRGKNFQGLVQAIRMSLHRDLLETLGIPSPHNFHYYLNQGGYAEVPTYVWSTEGPFPAACVMRTRYGLTEALNRKYAGTLDFGPTGNTLYFGVRYAGDTGETIVLRNFGAPASPLDFAFSGGPAPTATDCWGNALHPAVKDGHVTIEMGQLPVYLQLAKGETLSAPKIDYGRDLAPRARFLYSSGTKGAYSLLNDGILETYQAGDPNGDTNGDKLWQGDFNLSGQVLEMRFPRPQVIDKIILRTPHADNAFCTLLDYELQSWDGAAWKNLATVHRPMPASEPAALSDAGHAIWMDDTNVFPHSFPAVTTDKVRLVIGQTTHGYIPDAKARSWGVIIPEKVMLREVEVYSPVHAVRVEAALAGERAGLTYQATVHNRGSEPLEGVLRCYAPPGWKLEPSTPISLPAGASKTYTLPVTLPATVESGTAYVDAEVHGDKDALLDSAFATLTLAAPVTLTPQASSAAETTAEGALLKLNVQNTTGAPLSGHATVRLTGPENKGPFDQDFGPVPPGQGVNLTWRVPGLDLAVERWTAAFDVVAGGLRTTAQKELFGQNWAVVGPFPRGFDVPEGPEKTMKWNPTENYTDMMGNERRWQTVRPAADGLVNLADVIKPNVEVMAYAVTVVTSPTARKALFSVGTDDGGKGWLNGKVVYSDDGTHAAAPGQQLIPVDLVAGRNEIWLKVTQGSGAWGFYFDLLDAESGRPLGDINYRATP